MWWLLSVGLVPGHLVFLCNLYFRGFPQPRHPTELPTIHLSHLLQIVLAFGNYMNSSKRGAAYGFRLQSLDVVKRGGRRGPPDLRDRGGLGACGLQQVLIAAVGDEVDGPQADAAALLGEGHC